MYCHTSTGQTSNNQQNCNGHETDESSEQQTHTDRSTIQQYSSNQIDNTPNYLVAYNPTAAVAAAAVAAASYPTNQYSNNSPNHSYSYNGCYPAAAMTAAAVSTSGIISIYSIIYNYHHILFDHTSFFFFKLLDSPSYYYGSVNNRSSNEIDDAIITEPHALKSSETNNGSMKRLTVQPSFKIKQRIHSTDHYMRV